MAYVENDSKNVDFLDVARRGYQEARQQHWNGVARKLAAWRGWGDAYHGRLAQIYESLIPPGLSVLEIGCARGDLLAALKPVLGVGVDFSEEMLRAANERHPELRFVRADAHSLDINEKFDVIILSDLVNDIWDVQTVLQQVAQVATPRSRIIINSYSRLWEPILWVAEWMNLAQPTLDQNWLTVEDITGLLNLTDFEVIKAWPEVIWPLRTGFFSDLCNRYLVKLWPFKHFALTNVLVARARL